MAELFATDKPTKKLIGQVDALIRQHGCYRAFGDEVRLTEADADALMACLAARASTGEPGDDVQGHVVVVGHPTETDAPVYIGWARAGGVDKLFDDVVTHSSEPHIRIIDFVPASYGQYKVHRDALAKHKFKGRWYLRKPELLAYITNLLPKEE